jgi:hypothetical protein
MKSIMRFGFVALFCGLMASPVSFASGLDDAKKPADHSEATHGKDKKKVQKKAEKKEAARKHAKKKAAHDTAPAK